MTAYRNDTDALAARDEVLARELADKQRERAVVQRLLEEARAADAAAALDNDVRVGRRRLRRAALGLSILAVAGVAGGALFVSQHHGRAALAVAAVTTEPDETLFSLALATKGLTLVELEPRFVGGVGGVATPAEVDALVGAHVAPWEVFLYTRDAQVRQAVASPLYRGGDVEPTPEFVRDGDGGVWLVQRTVPRKAVLTHAAVRWSRKIWLLPPGSAFRGAVEIATAR